MQPKVRQDFIFQSNCSLVPCTFSAWGVLGHQCYLHHHHYLCQLATSSQFWSFPSSSRNGVSQLSSSISTHTGRSLSPVKNSSAVQPPSPVFNPTLCVHQPGSYGLSSKVCAIMWERCMLHSLETESGSKTSCIYSTILRVRFPGCPLFRGNFVLKSAVGSPDLVRCPESRSVRYSEVV